MTAFEMRISDWSSDVCSSDLAARRSWRGRSVRRAPSTSARALRAIRFAPTTTRRGWARQHWSPRRPSVAAHQAAVQAFDGEVRARLHHDRRVVGIAWQQADLRPGLLEALDGDLAIDPRHHHLPVARITGALHRDQVAVEDAVVTH